MNPALLRASTLLQQSRPDLAQDQVRQALSENPNDAYGLALMALCLIQRDEDKVRAKEAERFAQKAVLESPDFAFAHRVLGYVLLHDDRAKEARRAAQEAMRLDPASVQHYALSAQVELAERQWQAAVDFAERGLAVDASDGDCKNLRAMALTKLRRHDEAQDTIRQSMREEPENALAHANLGWTLLHRNDPKQALVHFKEALRLEPGDDWARAGLVEALKARNPIYRLLLGFFLYMSTLDPRMRTGLIIGAYILFRVLRGIADASPALSPWVWPILYVYMAFVLLTWVGVPLSNLLLRISRYGRHALSKHQRIGSNLFGLHLLLLAFCVAMLVWRGGAVWDQSVMVVGLMLMPVSVTLMMIGNRAFTKVALLVGLLGAVGAASIGFKAVDPAAETAGTLSGVFLLGFIGLIWYLAIAGSMDRLD